MQKHNDMQKDKTNISANYQPQSKFKIPGDSKKKNSNISNISKERPNKKLNYDEIDSSLDKLEKEYMKTSENIKKTSETFDRLSAAKSAGNNEMNKNSFSNNMQINNRRIDDFINESVSKSSNSNMSSKKSIKKYCSKSKNEKKIKNDNNSSMINEATLRAMGLSYSGNNNHSNHINENNYNEDTSNFPVADDAENDILRAVMEMSKNDK